MAKIKITQVVSRIGSTDRQKKNLDALGLKKMNQSVVHEDSPIILGMLGKVKHLVKIEPSAEGASSPTGAGKSAQKSAGAVKAERGNAAETPEKKETSKKEA